MILNGTLSHCTGNGNIFFSPPPKYFLSLDLPNEGIFQKLNVALTFLFNEYFDERRKMTFLVALLECLRGSRRARDSNYNPTKINLPPAPVKKSNNYIIQPSYTTDAQKCDKNSTEKKKSSFKEFGLGFAQDSTNCKSGWEDK